MRYTQPQLNAYHLRAMQLATHAKVHWNLHTCPDCGRWCMDLPFCDGADCAYMNGSISLLPPMPGQEKDA